MAARRGSVVGTFDPWNTDDGTRYDPDKFYVGSGNRETSENIGQVRVPNHIRALMQRIIEQRIFPQYQTKHDFIRDAIYHRLQYLRMREETGFTPEMAHQIKALLADADTEYEIHQAELATTRVERHVQLMKLYHDNGNGAKLWEAIERAQAVAETMETTLRNQLLDEVARYTALGEQMPSQMAQVRAIGSGRPKLVKRKGTS